MFPEEYLHSESNRNWNPGNDQGMIGVSYTMSSEYTIEDRIRSICSELMDLKLETAKKYPDMTHEFIDSAVQNVLNQQKQLIRNQIQAQIPEGLNYIISGFSDEKE